MPTRATLDHLTALYAADRDPWGHDTRPYERAKHRRTLAAIGPGPFRSAVEIGCGTGPLTGPLARVCENLIALECIPAALAEARSRVRRGNVTFVEAAAPSGLPSGLPTRRFDLVLLSEVLYFLEADEIDAVVAWIQSCAAPDCCVFSVNWTGSTGQTLSGREAADRLLVGMKGWQTSRQNCEGYILDATRRTSGGGDISRPHLLPSAGVGGENFTRSAAGVRAPRG